MHWQLILLRSTMAILCCIGSVSTALANTPTPCELSPLGNLDLNQPDKAFGATFCGNVTPESCRRRLSNLQYLIGRLSGDIRIQNVATAAYMVGTVYVETGSNDYSPDTDEAIGRNTKKQDYYPLYIGRGWVQLTHKDKYKRASRELHDFLIAHRLPTNLQSNTDVVKYPDVAYEILVRAMLEGWIETYRASSTGASGTIPIRLGDFITQTSVNYAQARAVINANWIAPKPSVRNERTEPSVSKTGVKVIAVGIHDVMVRPGEFLPDAAHLDAALTAANAARAAEAYICRIQKK